MNRLLLFIAGGVLAGCCGLLPAAELPPPQLERIDVPGEQPGIWPDFWRELIAVPRSEFERVWQATCPTPVQVPQVSLQHVTYHATLLGTELVDGSGRISLHSERSPGPWMTLSPWNLAVSSMSWVNQTEPALWGVGPDRQFWLALNSSAQDLDFTWSAAGTPIGQRTVFELQVPVAQSSQMVLRTPANQTLTCPQVPVRRRPQASPSDGTTSAWVEWELLLGSESRITLVCESITEAPTAPMVTYRRQMIAALREDHLRFEALFQLEVLNGELQDLELTAPAAAHVYAVTWGNDLPLEWTRVSTSGPRDTIRIRFPDAQSGPVRSIRLEGIVSQRPGAAISLPQIEFPHGVFRSGEIQVSVSRPHMLTMLRATGCRPQAPVLTSSEGETHQFLQTSSLAQLTVEVRRPRSVLSAQVLSTVNLNPEDWTWINEILWSSHSSTAFQLAVRVPADWEVTEVALLSESGEIEPLNWDLTKEADGSLRVAMELLEAITPDRSRRIQISARHAPLESRSQFPCPVLEPQDCQTVSTLVRVDGGEQYVIFPPAKGTWTEWQVDQIPVTWQPFLSLAGWKSTGKTARWYEVPQRTSDLWLTLYPRPEPATAQVEILAEVNEGLLTETFRLRVRPSGPARLSRLLVSLSEAGSDVAWNVREPANLSLISSRLPLSHNPKPLSSQTGELWELRLPDTDAPELQIEGVRTRPLSLPVSVGLVFLPQAEVPSSTVTVQAAEAQGVQLVARGMTEQTSSAVNPSRPAPLQRWDYDSSAAQLMLVSRRSSLQEPPCLAQLQFKSLLSAFQSGADSHRAVITLSAHTKTLRFQFPSQVELESVLLDDQALLVAKDNSLLIPPHGSPRPSQLHLQYRLRQAPGFLRDRRQIPMPICKDVVWTECEWEFYLPPSAVMVREPTGLRFTSALSEPSWFDRLFGPLGRSQTPLFVPWDPETWITLSGRSSESANPELVELGEFEAPTQWQKVTAYSPYPQAHWTVESWHRGRLRILSWLAMLLTLSIVISIRQAGLSVRTRIACVWLAVWVGIAIAIEPPWVEIVGGVIAGSIVGWLLPRGWLRWRVAKPRVDPMVPVGSTQSFLLPKQVVTTCWVLCAVGLTSLAAPTNPVPENIEQILLVPVDPDGQPARKLPLVYLHPRTWKALREQAEALGPVHPNWLVQSVQITGQLGTGPRLPLKLEALVLAFGYENQVTMNLPPRLFQSATTQNCRVDGVPANITPHPSGMGYQVTWQRTPPPISAMQLPVATPHVLTLEWQQSWQPDGSQNAVDIPLLPAAATVAKILSTQGSPPPSEASTAAVTPPLSQARAGSAQVDLPLRWPAEARPAAVAEVHVNIVEACELAGDVWETRSRVIFHPRIGTVQNLPIQLPPQAVVRRWSASQTADFRATSTASLPRHRELSLESATADEVVLELDYVTPATSLQPEQQWSGIECLPASDLKISHVDRWMSVYSPVDFKVLPVATETAGLLLLDFESVREQFKGLVQDRIPQATYQVSQRPPIRLQILPNNATRKLLLWQQTGTLQGDRLKWEVEGELEASGVPVYVHQLTLDRRLIIDSISVRERGTERLARRSESRSPGNSGSNRVTLYLTDPVTETQRITITASMPFSPDTTLSLPNVRCEDAELSGGRLVFHAQDALDVHWLSARGLRELPTSPNTMIVPLENPSQTWIFDQLEVDWRATIRAASPVNHPQTRVAHVISSDDPQALQCQSLWRIPTDRLRGAAAILVPAPWEVASDSAITGGNFQVTRSPQGEWSVGIEGEPTATETFVKLRLRIQRAALKSAQLPLPRPLGDIAEDLEVWIAEHTRLPQLPLLELKADPPLDDGPTDWLQGPWQMPAPLETDRYRWLKSSAETVTLLPLKPSSTRTVNVPWVEHILWQNTIQSVRGISQLQLSEAQLALTVQFPNGLHLRAAVIDDQPAETRVEVEGQVQMSAMDGRPFRSLRLFWDQTTSDPVTPLGAWESVWPTLPHAHVQQLAICVIPDDSKRIRGRGEWSSGDWIDRLLLRLETQGDALTGDPQAPDFQQQRQRFQEQYEAGALQLGHEHVAFDQAPPQRHSRWQSIVERVNQLPATGGSSPARPSHFEITFPTALVTQPGILYGMLPSESSGARWWVIDRSWLGGIAGLLMTALLWPALVFLLRPPRNEWWHARPNLATSTLGLVWWLCLVPSILGFALLAMGLYRMVFGRSAVQSTKESSTVSTTAAAE